MAKQGNTVTRWCRRAMALAVPSLLLFSAVLPTSASAACPNEAIREAQTSEALPLGTTAFPACMALEMLSPPKKFGQETGELSAFSSDGTRALYKSKAALAGTEGLQSFIGDSYVGIRESGGWATHPTSPPASAQIQVGGTNIGGPYTFGSDLGDWVLFGAIQAQQYPAEGQLFRGSLDGSLRPLSPLLVPINDSGTTIQGEISNFAASGTSADLSASIFPTFFESTAYFPGDPRNSGAGKISNSYLAFIDENGDPALELLARDGVGTVYGGRCGSTLGNGNLNQGAISPDGSRIYFSTRPDQPPSVGTAGPPCDTDNPLRIMVREEASGGPAIPEDPTISELIPGGPAEGDDLYQGASLDSSKVFLASPRKLTASDLDASSQTCSSDVGTSKGCDLYLYDESLPPAERLVQVSAGEDVSGQHEAGKGADVLTSAVALSPDGSHVYFVAQGVLTDDTNPAGASPTAGKPNLYLYQRDTANPDGAISFIGTLAETDKGELWGLGRSFSNGAYAVPMTGDEDGGDGHILFLTSEASLTSDDTDGGFTDIFRFDAAADVQQCITCSSAAPEADIVAGPNKGLEMPPSSNFAEQGRWVSEDGETVAFATAQPLAPGDDDDAANPYLWKEGLLTRLPGAIKEISQRPVISLGGDIVGFGTTASLLSQDGDTARDIYLARVNGGFLPPPPKTICDPLVEGSCQGPPIQPGSGAAVATGAFIGPGNPKKQLCKKGKVRKRGRCVKPREKKSRKAGKRASSKQRGAK